MLQGEIGMWKTYYGIFRGRTKGGKIRDLSGLGNNKSESEEERR